MTLDTDTAYRAAEFVETFTGGAFWPLAPKAEHVSIILQFGAIAPTMPTSVQILCTQTNTAGEASPPVGQNIGFRFYTCTSGGPSVDTLSPPQIATTAGILQATLSKLGNSYLIIEIDSAEIDILGDSDELNQVYPFLQLVINNGPNATLASAVAVMSGYRQAYQGNLSATV